MKHYLSLRAKLVLETTILIVTIFLIILALVSYTTVRNTMENAEKATKDIHNTIITKGLTLVRNNSTALHIFAVDNSFTSVQELVSNTVQEPTVIYGIYMDRNRLPWVKATPSNPQGLINIPAPLDDTLSIWAAQQYTAAFKQTIYNNTSIYEFVAPVMHNDETLGYIRYGISTNEMSRAIVRAKLESVRSRNRAIVWILSVGAFFTALGYIIIQVMATKITKPINHLVKEAQMITAGDYSVEVEVESHDEIGRLAEEFELMRRKILQYTSELESKNEELEARILERTKKLEDAMEAAKNANEAKSEFLANMSHEIRTPMNSILGFTQLLIENESSSDKVDQLKTILSSGETLLKLINDILDFSKIESGKMELASIPFSLGDLLNHIEQVFSLKAQQKGIQLKVSIESHTPDYLIGDDIRINQILVNLIGNAFKFTHEGGIYIKAEYQSGEIYMTIKDTGIGIPKDRQDRIFEPFMQADGSVTRKYGGTGLGLVITSRLIEQMQGTLTMNSMEGVGTTFVIKLPLPEGAAPKIKKENHQLKHASGECCIGIIEDNPDDRDYLNRIISSRGYKVVELTNSETVVNEVLETSIDLIILDLKMTGKNGFEINEILKQDIRTAHIPIIACSGTEEVENTIYYGMVDYVKKPVDQHMLLSRIEGALTQTATLKNIYLIDDNPQLLKLYSSYLLKEGYAVQTFEAGIDALNQLDKGDIPDFIILDLLMPGMDGFDFLNRMRQQEKYKTIPTIIVTAKELEEDEIKRLSTETLGVFEKGADTEKEFLSFIGNFFTASNQKGEEMVKGWFDTMGSDKELSDLLRETIESLPESMHKLEEAILHKNLQNIDSTSHALKGVCLNYHINEIGEKAKLLNDITRHSAEYSPEMTRIYLEIKSLYDLIPKRFLKNRPKYFAKTTTVEEEHIQRYGKILLAEDIVANQKLIQAFLTKSDLSCDVADNGQIALDMMEQEQYSILFLDMQMPVLDGTGVLEAMHKEPKRYGHPYIVALTANAIKGESEKYIQMGCDSYLSKPVRMDTLLALVDKVLMEQNDK